MDPLFGTASLAAAFFGGVLALLAPCCITFLLPSYLAAGLRQGRLQLARTTLVFAAGLSAVLLPVAWGLAGLAQLIPQLHRELFLLGGVLLLALGALAITGHWSLPMPWTPRITGHGPASVFALGAFSGAASSCCAPVLAGVLALGIVAPAWWLALGVGLAYVFGMVFPLLLVALLGERADLSRVRWLRPRELELRVLGRHVTVGSLDLAAAVLLWAMAGLVLWLALTGQTAYSPDALQAIYYVVRDSLDRLTAALGPASPLVVVVAVAVLVWLWSRRHATTRVADAARTARAVGGLEPSQE